MKKLGLLLIGMTLMSSSALAVLIDNFESTPLGNLEDVASPPWIITTPADATEVPAIEVEDNGNQYLESVSSSIDCTGIAEGEIGTVFFRVMLPEGRNPDCSFGMSDVVSSTGAWGDFESYCTIVGDVLRLRDGGSQVDVANLDENTWYNIWLVSDNASDTHDLYLTTGSNEPTADDQIADGLSFRNGTSDTLGCFKIYGRGNASDAQALFFDDIYITSGVNLTLDMFEYQSGQSSNPAPFDGEEDVALDADLSWQAGHIDDTHDIYFGSNYDDVNDASRSNPGSVLVSQGQSDMSYSPAGLDLDGVYYWRVDEVNSTDNSIVKGNVWSFSAEPTNFDAVPVAATASSFDVTPDFNMVPENTINGSGLNESGHSTLTSTMWRTAENDLVGAWIQYEFDTPYQFHQMHVWNFNSDSETFLGEGVKDALIQTSLDGQTWTSLGQVQLTRANGTHTYSGQDVSLEDTIAQYVKIEVVTQQGSFIDGNPIIQKVGLSEVQFQAVPIAARRPSPADGATAGSLFDTLTWRLGRDAQASRLYVSTDANLVATADESVLVATVSGRRYSIADTGAQYDETYAWRVDEVYSDSVVAGPVWSFNSPEYLVVDDMESYTSIEGSRIFDPGAWSDGYGDDNGNGSIVGYDVADGPYTEREITFDGSGKSMPFTYEDEDGASAAWATLDLGGQDWSVGGLKTLVLYFLGDADNDEATFYIEVDGKRVESSKSLKSTVWQQLAVDIDTLNIDLTSVDEFIVGVDGAGVEGLLLIDEIRVCREVHIAASPVDPQEDGLVVYYNMEDNVENQVDSKYDGIPNVTMFYSNDSVNDDFGSSLIFDGTESEVNIPDLSDLLSTLTSSSYSGWISIDEDATGNWMRLFDFGTGTENYMFVSPRTGTAGEVRAAIKTQAMNDDETGEAGVTSAAPLVDGWHHLAMVIEEGDPNGLLTLYVDGWSAGTVETPGMPADLGETTQNWLGESQWDGDDLYDGQMDEFRIYNRALSEGEVRYLAGDR